jgi:hypothetical protein
MRIKQIALAFTLATVGTACIAPTLAQAQTGGAAFPFNRYRPKLVVLLHGVTSRKEDVPEQKINEPGHGRGYWGFDFVKQLQGPDGEETYMRMVVPQKTGMLTMEPVVSSTEWKPQNVVNNTNSLAPIYFSQNVMTPPAGVESNTTLIKSYISSMAYTRYPMVMTPFRDGAVHMMPQLGSAIDQIYSSYVTAFGHLPTTRQPQIYMVGHSFGGIMARGIFAAPYFSTWGVDISGQKLTAVQVERARYLRDRTVLVNTLASPHQGTFMPDFSNDLNAFIAAGGDFFKSMEITFLGIPFPDVVTNWIKTQLASLVNKALRAIGGNEPSLQDVRKMATYNAGILAPHTANRTDGSKVPIFTMAGRNPGNMYFDRPRSMLGFADAPAYGNLVDYPVDIFDVVWYGNKHAFNAFMLYLNDQALRLRGYGKEGKRPWGYAYNSAGDKFSGPYALVGPSSTKPLNDPLFYSGADLANFAIDLGTLLLKAQPYGIMQSDGEYDSDGFLGWDSAMALGWSQPNYYRVYDEGLYGKWLPWDIDNHDTIRFNPGNAAWIYNELILEAGPKTSSIHPRRSVWDGYDIPSTPMNNVRIELTEVRDTDSYLDGYGFNPDFRISILAGNKSIVKTLPKDTRVVTNAATLDVTNYPSTVIPIRIVVNELDGSDWPASPDDLCHLGTDPAKTSLYLYFDTRTQSIVGDVKGDAGQVLTINPHSNAENRVTVKVRISQF